MQFQKALDIKPDYAEAHYSLGVAAAGRGRMDEAIAHYRKAIAAPARTSPSPTTTSATPCFFAASSTRRWGIFWKRCEIRPDFAEAYYNLGNALYVLGRLGEAMTQYEKALEFRPDYAEAHYNLDSLGGPRPASTRRWRIIGRSRKSSPAVAEARASLANWSGTGRRVSSQSR